MELLLPRVRHCLVAALVDRHQPVPYRSKGRFLEVARKLNLHQAAVSLEVKEHKGVPVDKAKEASLVELEQTLPEAHYLKPSPKVDQASSPSPLSTPETHFSEELRSQ